MIDTLLLLIPALPLAACLFLVLAGRALKEKSHWPVVLAFAGSFVLSVLLLIDVRKEAEVASTASEQKTIGYERTYTLWTWTDVEDAYTPRPQSPDTKHPGTQTPPAVNFTIDVTLRADPLTCFMLCMVTFISTLVAIYASGYMHGDPGYPRFFIYVALFVFSMTMLVSVSNFLLLYVFWEAVGLCSYLLVGFWYQKPEAVAAGKKAFLVNRVGDFGFAIGLFLIWTTYGTLNYHDTFAKTADGTVQQVAGVLGQTRLAAVAEPSPLGRGQDTLTPTLSQGEREPYATGGVAVAICLLLLAGACGKSAQFPLHVWLPDAMEGPTPVSALIHAATMVTAGVYMIARCTPLFMASAGTPWFTVGDSPVDAQMVVATVGGISALMAGIIAVTQTDLKRVLAYSTISQLGYMFLALGTGSLLGIVAGMFHLLTHACFKALLFLSAGSVMHAMGGVIDMRRIGGLRKLMPITCFTFLMGGFALAGLFPFAGFWSKDAILGAVHDKAGSVSGFASGLYNGLYWVGVFTAGLTAFYTFRGFFLTFFGEQRIPPEAGHHAASEPSPFGRGQGEGALSHRERERNFESPKAMTVPLMILAFLAVTIGGYFAWTGGILDFLRLTPSLAYQTIADTVGTEPKSHGDVMIVSTVFVLVGIALASFLYLGSPAQATLMSRLLRPLYWLSYGKFFFDPIYQAFVVWPLEVLARIGYWFDRYVLDGLVNLVGALPGACGWVLRSLQNGMVQFYALAMVLGLLVLIGALALWPAG